MLSTIYIVVTDSAIRGGLVELLSSLKLPVCGYTNADEFMAAEQDHDGGFLVVDFDSGYSAGFKFLQRLQARNIRLPIVLIASHCDNVFKAKALNAGVVDVIEKPLVNDVLLARIRQCLPEVVLPQAEQG